MGGIKRAMRDRLGEAANVAFMDAMIGKIFNELEKEKILDNTAIFFFSDHSIFLGRHGRKHKGTLFREVIAASLIVSYPKLFPENKVIYQPVELLDIIPTSFELAGISREDEKKFRGKSLIPLLTDKKNSDGRKYAFSEILGAQSAIDGRYHYIRCGSQEFLYDWKNDPYEMKNTAENLPEITKRFRSAVNRWLENTAPVLKPNSF
jgi:choline-sulfatase